ncbi:uncharacterized protein J8A68_002237 [[Candida] subhashii]|uniref:Uncharacterized protein n=1 Tax=[Candida] subhashii TaxID=561895 RepID=A0A8J5QPV5_9ASCO|nr:uncharacterized protein J8A68_002237 [[Candida] subhashii]KAG7664223.1 hypothetical protein J8A68_002237 [[Candida] subhashii]
MGRHPLKRKIVSATHSSHQQHHHQHPQSRGAPQQVNTYVPNFPPTKYGPSPATLKNFPSSIVNGVTLENGLYSLTFKSIACVDYVDNQDMMKSTKRKLESDESDRIGKLQKVLQDALETKQVLGDFESNLKEQKIIDENKAIIVSNNRFHRVEKLTIPDLKIDKIEDVKNLDTTPYDKENKQVSNPGENKQEMIEEKEEPVGERIEQKVEENVPVEVVEKVEEKTEIDIEEKVKEYVESELEEYLVTPPVLGEE